VREAKDSRETLKCEAAFLLLGARDSPMFERTEKP
jgi:hypothetical protein